MEAALALGAEIMLPKRVAEADARFMISGADDKPAISLMFLMTNPDRVHTPSVAAKAAWVATTARQWLRSGGSDSQI